METKVSQTEVTWDETMVMFPLEKTEVNEGNPRSNCCQERARDIKLMNKDIINKDNTKVRTP